VIIIINACKVLIITNLCLSSNLNLYFNFSINSLETQGKAAYLTLLCKIETDVFSTLLNFLYILLKNMIAKVSYSYQTREQHIQPLFSSRMTNNMTKRMIQAHKKGHDILSLKVISNGLIGPTRTSTMGFLVILFSSNSL